MSESDRLTSSSASTENRAPPSRWWANPEMLIALAALLTSVVAVVVGGYEAYLQRHHDRAEVWPHVEIGLWESPQGAAIQISNTGIGPARIESLDVIVDGKAMRD